MLPEGYEYKKSTDPRQYEFQSNGPKGSIRKIIIYSFMGTQYGRDVYNLGFGDYDASTGKILDLVVSDNRDQIKILATVAATVLDFIAHHSDCAILVTGSTPARTRLYQMNISRHYGEISKMFDLQCLTKEGRLTKFKRGENYEGFFLKIK